MTRRLITAVPLTPRVRARVRLWLTLGLVASLGLVGVAQGQGQGAPPAQAAGTLRTLPASQPAPPPNGTIAVASDYVIGPTDVLGVVFWGERDLSMDVSVRPDGKITLPLLNDVMAAGLTPEQLRLRLTEESKRFFKEPRPPVTVVVRQVNNNRAYITGQIQRPGPYTLTGAVTILQLIASAGGFTEFADRRHVVVTRTENGTQRAFTFDYDAVIKRRDLSQNLVLRPGDTVVVP